ncbi:MAG: hypothetical protein ACF8XB_06640 [Planctomycetota bacterium JB042]
MQLVRTALALTVLVSSAGAGTVGLDARSLSAETGWNPATDARYATFRSVFTGAGHSLTNLTAFTAPNLSGLDLLVLFHPTTPTVAYDATEIADIQAYVASGRSLLVVADAGWSTTSSIGVMNQILLPYGITVGSGAVNGSGAQFGGFFAHPTTDGVNAIGLDFHRYLTVGAGAIDLQNGTNDIIAASESGGGRVVAIGDGSCFTDAGFGADYDITSLDNRKFLETAIGWLILPFGDGCPGAGGFVPELTATSYAPAAGTQLGLQLQQGLGGAPATFFFGLGQSAIPMVGGCTLNIAPLLPINFTVPLGGAGAGNGSIFLAGVLPNDMGGVTFSMQAFVVDASVAHGFSNSNEIVVAVQ